MGRFFSLRIASVRLAVVAFALGATFEAAAADKVMLNEEVTWAPNGGQAIHEVWFNSPLGTNWTSPVNYDGGPVNIRFVIKEIPKTCGLGTLTYWNNKGGNHGYIMDPVGISETTPGKVWTKAAKLGDGWHSHPWNWSNVATRFRIQIRELWAKSLSVLRFCFPPLLRSRSASVFLRCALVQLSLSSITRSGFSSADFGAPRGARAFSSRGASLLERKQATKVICR